MGNRSGKTRLLGLGGFWCRLLVMTCVGRAADLRKTVTLYANHCRRRGFMENRTLSPEPVSAMWLSLQTPKRRDWPPNPAAPAR